jgi:hypothetical protein
MTALSSCAPGPRTIATSPARAGFAKYEHSVNFLLTNYERNQMIGSPNTPIVNNLFTIKFSKTS